MNKHTFISICAQRSKKALSFFAIVLSIIALGVGQTAQVRADEYDEKIRQLNQLNAQNREAQSDLQAEAASLSQKISNLRSEIAGLNKQIAANQTKNRQVKKEITAAQKELERQREILGQNIKQMYLESDMSTIEMIASSNNISEYLDRETYRNSVQGKIKATMDRINALRDKLEAQKKKLEKLISDQKAMQSRLNTQRAELDKLLSLNKSQQAAYDSKISSNNARIAELRRQQAIENARLSGGSPGVGANCGGGYPGSTPGPWGVNWGCYHGIDNTVDNWGMYNRQCVSYTAFRVANSGRHMPYWGGYGNAKNWDDNARNMGIPVDTSPRVGDVGVSNAGTYGHVFYVEQVAGDGSVYISDYNQQYDGRYREYWISASTLRARGIVFIHF